MNSISPIETAEILDADLDTISGGLAGGVAVDLHVDLAGITVCADAGAALSADGVQAGANLHLGAH